MRKISRKPAPGLGFEPDSVVHRLGMALFHFVKPKAIKVMRSVEDQPGKQLRREFHAIRLRFLQRSGRAATLGDKKELMTTAA